VFSGTLISECIHKSQCTGGICVKHSVQLCVVSNLYFRPIVAGPRRMSDSDTQYVFLCAYMT